MIAENTFLSSNRLLNTHNFLENMVTDVIKNICKVNPTFTFITQKNFKYVRDTCDISVPESLLDRKFDYAIINQGKGTTIEVNYYGGTGSKPSEIVSSYINRKQVLSEKAWQFVWLTDGIGWKKMRNPLYVGIKNIDYVINSHLLRYGILGKIILQ